MKEVFQQLSRGEPLHKEQVEFVFAQLLAEPSSDPSTNTITDAQIGAYLFATSVRVPSEEELSSAARMLRRTMIPFERDANVKVLDTCGTGGSGFSTFNTSTMVAFVCASAGQAVAKHGNRAASSKSGSADVLEALGFSLSADASQQRESLEKHNFTFLFAPAHHPAAKRVALLRKELGLRTIFNFLGPLASPAKAEYQLLGVSAKEALAPMAGALANLGVERAYVVRGQDGLDELSGSANSDVFHIQDGVVTHFELNPRELPITSFTVEDIEISSVEHSVAAVQSVLSGDASAFRELVVLNAGAALCLCGKRQSIAEGIEYARELLDTGAVKRTVEELTR